MAYQLVCPRQLGNPVITDLDGQCRSEVFPVPAPMFLCTHRGMAQSVAFSFEGGELPVVSGSVSFR